MRAENRDRNAAERAEAAGVDLRAADRRAHVAEARVGRVVQHVVVDVRRHHRDTVRPTSAQMRAKPAAAWRIKSPSIC